MAAKVDSIRNVYTNPPGGWRRIVPDVSIEVSCDQNRNQWDACKCLLNGKRLILANKLVNGNCLSAI